MSVTAATCLESALVHEDEKLLACIHCGLCLQACPTYVQTGDENDSPRGRVYLMRAVREERLPLSSPAFSRHIDRCLGCRACEQACPSGVEYGHLLEAARSDLLNSQPASGTTQRVLRFVLKYIWMRPSFLSASFLLSRVFRSTGIPRLLVKSGIARLVSPRAEFGLLLLASSSPATIDKGDSIAKDRGSHRAIPMAESNACVSMFLGCVMEGLFVRINRATERVAAANGFAVDVPSGQGCCGALHAHAGDLEGARELARRNISALENSESPIVTNAGGCGAMLASYGSLLADDSEFSERARCFADRVADISQLLAKSDIRPGVPVSDATVTYDASCHLIYGQHSGDAPLAMLRAIPEIKFVPLDGANMCCGGAGVYNLLERELSTKILNDKLEKIRLAGATILATGNPGCHMQIAAGAKLVGLELQVVHPVELLDLSYKAAGYYDA